MVTSVVPLLAVEYAMVAGETENRLLLVPLTDSEMFPVRLAPQTLRVCVPDSPANVGSTVMDEAEAYMVGSLGVEMVTLPVTSVIVSRPNDSS